MNVLITTQYQENYGTAQEPRWKYKGGEDYIISIPDQDPNEIVNYVNRHIKSLIEYSNDMAIEYINGIRIVDVDYITEYEKSQLEYDGEILYPAKRFTLETEMVLVSSDGRTIGSRGEYEYN